VGERTAARDVIRPLAEKPPPRTAMPGASPAAQSSPGISGGYDAEVQPPPPGSPPWGPPPDNPWGGHGYGGQPGPEIPAQPPPPGYGAPAWAAYGPPASAPTAQQTVGWISFASIGLLGLLGAILTLTLWINLTSAVSRAADMCNRFGGEYANLCRHQIKSMVPTLPVALVVCLFLIIAAALAVASGAAMLSIKRPMGQFLILGGGIVMLVLSIGCEARYGATGRVTYDLIAGLVIAATAGLMFVPGFRVVLGLPPHLVNNASSGGFPAGGPWPPGPAHPPSFGPPGPPPQW
jgi:hypothetical protein